MLGDQLPGQVPADLAGADDHHVHGLTGHSLEADLAAYGGLQQLDRGLGRTDGLQALLRVPAGPGRVEHPDDHALDIEAALGDLGDDEVGVVAVGRRYERVRLLDTGGEQRLDLQGGALGEAPAALLPALVLAALEQRDRLRVLVEDRDLVPLLEHRVRDRRPHATASNNQYKHSRSTLGE